MSRSLLAGTLTVAIWIGLAITLFFYNHGQDIQHAPQKVSVAQPDTRKASTVAPKAATTQAVRASGDAVADTTKATTTTATATLSTIAAPEASNSISKHEHHQKVAAILPAKKNSAKSKIMKTSHDYLTPMSWMDFIKSKSPITDVRTFPAKQKGAMHSDKGLNICPESVVDKLSKPQLSQEDVDWCKWSLSPSGGKVKVGQSYGVLNKAQRAKYEQQNCNAVATEGSNPSCDDAWGDGQITSWKKNSVDNLCGDSSAGYTSTVKCSTSSSEAKFCAFENLQFDFSKMHTKNRPGSTNSRTWDNGFASSHCDAHYTAKELSFYAFYAPSIKPKEAICDYVINETVLVYSHDDPRNLGHTMSDMMNVWAMLWMAGAGSYAEDITFFNIDAFRGGHNLEDEHTPFFKHYQVSFDQTLKASDFAKVPSSSSSSSSSSQSGGQTLRPATVCFRRAIMPMNPVMMFTWDGWWMDMPCSFMGPSTLFQRWNMHIRNNYGLLAAEKMPTNEKLQVLLILRRTNSKQSSSMYTSRVFKNEADVIRAVKDALPPDAVLVSQDMSTLSFEKQVELISSSSLVIGVHGAGIPHSMHMPIGTKHCCGVIEIFPEGEFKGIHGYGNMARKMGHVYSRFDVGPSNSATSGVNVPTEILSSKVKHVLEEMSSEEKRSCVMPTVISDPYLDSVDGVCH